MRSAVSASSRSSSTVTSTMPANLPANRDIWLRSQLAPCALTGTETADTRPGRSSPMTVRTRWAILAGYETYGPAVARTVVQQHGYGSSGSLPPASPLRRESFRRPLAPRQPRRKRYSCGRRATGELRLLVQTGELVRVPHREDPRDPPLLDHDADDRGAAHLVLDLHTEAAVEPDRRDRGIDGDRWEGAQKVDHLLHADHGHAHGLRDPAAVGEEHHVRGEDVHQALHVSSRHRGNEPFHHLLLLGAVDPHPWPSRGDVL